MNQIIRIELDKGALLLDLQGNGSERFPWRAEGDVGPALLVARHITREYSYPGPHEGYPGCYLAWLVANKVGGKVIIPVLPRIPEGAVS